MCIYIFYYWKLACLFLIQGRHGVHDRYNVWKCCGLFIFIYLFILHQISADGCGTIDHQGCCSHWIAIGKGINLYGSCYCRKNNQFLVIMVWWSPALSRKRLPPKLIFIYLSWSVLCFLNYNFLLIKREDTITIETNVDNEYEPVC